MYRFIFFLIVINFPLRSFTQAINKKDLDSLFTFHDEHKNIMGSIAISKNGEILYSKAIGYSLYKNDEKISASEKTKYRIGSVSKIFTATIIFQLIEECKINLTTPIEKYFPGFPNAKLITITNLLNHTSGIPNFTRIKLKEIGRTKDEMLEIILRKKSKFIPGKKQLYSNANYLLLGYIIENVLNKPYEKVLEDRIISRIGLTDTYYKNGSYIEKNESLPYNFKTTWILQPLTNLSIVGASGGIISTPIDLTKFIEALFSGKLINQNSINKMKTISGNYGMGMHEFKFNSKRALGQEGSIDGFQSVVAYFPEDTVAIAFCSNGRVGPVKDLLMEALTIYFGLGYKNLDLKLSE